MVPQLLLVSYLTMLLFEGKIIPVLVCVIKLYTMKAYEEEG
jgi:hypothetical protein